MSTPAQSIEIAAVPDSAEAVATVNVWARVEMLVLASVVFGAAGQLLLKAALLVLTPQAHNFIHSASGMARVVCIAGVLLGLGIYAAGTWFWVRAVSRAAISYLYPLSASSYMLVALGGHLLFKETVSPGRWLGILVMTAGVALLAASADRSAV